MADAAGRGGFGSRGGAGGDRGRGDRGRGGRGRGRGRRGAGKSEEKEWQPVTKLGRLVKAGKIKSMEEIYLHSLPIKEFQIVDHFLPKLKDEVMKVSNEQTPPALGTGCDWRRRLRPELSLEEEFRIGWALAYSDVAYRLNPFRSRPVPVSVPVSRLSLSSVTPRVTSVSASRPPRKSRLPSVRLSSSPSCRSFLSVVDTGVPPSENPTPWPLRSPESVVLSLFGYAYCFQLGWWGRDKD